MSKYSLSFKSICSYFIPNAFNELGPGFSPIPITVCNVSYGNPVIDIIVSFGLSSPCSVTANACEPDIN